MAMADPVVISDPQISIDGVDYKCASSKVSLIPTDSQVDISTFCNPGGTRPGTTAWACSVDLLLSYTDGTDTGSWNTLHALRKTKVPIIIAPASGMASASNPTATFDAYIPSIPLVDAEIGGTVKYTLALSSVGEPVIAVS